MAASEVKGMRTEAMRESFAASHSISSRERSDSVTYAEYAGSTCGPTSIGSLLATRPRSAQNKTTVAHRRCAVGPRTPLATNESA